MRRPPRRGDHDPAVIRGWFGRLLSMMRILGQLARRRRTSPCARRRNRQKTRVRHDVWTARMPAAGVDALAPQAKSERPSRRCRMFFWQSFRGGAETARLPARSWPWARIRRLPAQRGIQWRAGAVGEARRVLKEPESRSKGGMNSLVTTLRSVSAITTPNGPAADDPRGGNRERAACRVDELILKDLGARQRYHVPPGWGGESGPPAPHASDKLAYFPFGGRPAVCRSLFVSGAKCGYRSQWGHHHHQRQRSVGRRRSGSDGGRAGANLQRHHGAPDRRREAFRRRVRCWILKRRHQGGHRPGGGRAGHRLHRRRRLHGDRADQVRRHRPQRQQRRQPWRRSCPA